MFNFKDLVSDILLEQPQPIPGTLPPNAPPLPNTTQPQSQQASTQYPTWFTDILNAHKKLGLGEVTEADIKKIFPIVTKGYISGQDAQIVGKNIRILDVLKNLWESAKTKPAKNLRDFFNNNSINKYGAQERNVIVQYTNKDQWIITNGLVANALGKEPGKSRIDYLQQALTSLAGFGGAKLYG